MGECCDQKVRGSLQATGRGDGLARGQDGQASGRRAWGEPVFDLRVEAPAFPLGAPGGARRQNVGTRRAVGRGGKTPSTHSGATASDRRVDPTAGDSISEPGNSFFAVNSKNGAERRPPSRQKGRGRINGRQAWLSPLQ